MIVTGGKEEISRFREAFFVYDPINEEGDPYNYHFDFNRIIPMPKAIEDTFESSYPVHGVELLLYLAYQNELLKPQIDNGIFTTCTPIGIRMATGIPYEPLEDVVREYLRIKPDVKEDGEKSLKALAETGYLSWFGWSVENWGTRRNPSCTCLQYDEEERLEFLFETEWSFPKPIIMKASSMFPTLDITVLYYDEGGDFAGQGSLGPNGVGLMECHGDEIPEKLYEQVYGVKPPGIS